MLAPGTHVSAKLELLQRTGSFKARGAFASLLLNPGAERGVVAASGGNHGAAVAYAAMRLGAYGVPVNWHFKPEEINYVLKDCGTSVLIVVSVTMDTINQIQSHLLAHQYEGLIEKSQLRGKKRSTANRPPARR